MTQNKSSDRQRQVMPLPEIINRPEDPAHVQAKPWHVCHDANGQGATDLANRTMYAPLGESDDDFAVRAHEMLHVKWSPLPSADGNDLYALAAEDGRIETLATMAGIMRPETHPGKSVAAECFAKGEYAAGMCCSVAVVGSPGEQVTRDALAAAGNTEALALMDFAAEQYAADHSWGSTESVAARLREIVAASESDEEPDGGPSDGTPEPAESSKDESGEGSESGESVKADPDAKPGTPKPAKPRSERKESRPELKPADLPAHAPRPAAPAGEAKPESEAPKPVPKPVTRRDGKAKADDLGEAMPVDIDELTADMPIATEYDWRKGDGASTWSKPSLSIPPRPIILTQDEKGRKRSRSTDYGTVPTRMHRAAVDDRVFTARKHKRQGTVLMDMSGSMHISAEEIKALIDHAPAAVIAGYWGRGGTGVLRILASGGRMVSESNLRPTGHGNEIDGPALAWLARQRAPRIWVCDDKLTGTEDIPVSKDLRAFCDRIIRQSRIRRIGSMRDLDAIKRWLR